MPRRGRPPSKKVENATQRPGAGRRATKERHDRGLRNVPVLQDEGYMGYRDDFNSLPPEDRQAIQEALPNVNESMHETLDRLETSREFSAPASTPFFDPTYERKKSQLELLKRLQLTELAELGKLDFWTFLTEILYPAHRQHYTLEFHGPICEAMQNLGTGENLLLCVPREARKCLAPETRVTMADGSLREARHIRPGDMLLAQTETGWKLQWSVVEAVEPQPNGPMVQVRFRSGRVINVTTNHPMRTILGWTDAGLLDVGSRVAVARHLSVQGTFVDPDVAAILGYLVGDGGTTQSTPVFSTADPGVLSRLTKLVETFGGQVKYRSQYDYGVLGVQSLPGLSELKGKRATEKDIPTLIMTAQDEAVQAFLGAWFDCDGGFAAAGRSPKVMFYTSSEKLARSGLHILTRLGFAASIHHRNVRGGTAPAWTLSISGKHNVQKFFDEVPLCGHRINQRAAMDMSKKAGGNHWLSTLPVEWRELLPVATYRMNADNNYATSEAKVRDGLDALGLDVPELRAVLDGDVRWDTVVEVIPTGMGPSIGIQTSTGTLLVEDLVSHNTYVTLAYIIWQIVRNPNIRIKIVARNLERAQLLCAMIRDVFLYDKRDRYIMFHEVYPDFTITSRKELSKVLMFTHPLRTSNLIDPTIFGTYMGSTGAGGRCDILVIDDGWDAKTLGNQQQGAKVFQQFLDFLPLVEASSFGTHKNIIITTTPWKHFDPTAKILGIDKEGLTKDQLRASPTFKIIVRHALETDEPCDRCPPTLIPHGRPDFKEGKPVLAPIFSRKDYESRLEQYQIDPDLGENSFWLQYMVVYANPETSKFKEEWFVVHTVRTWPVAKKRIITLDDASKDFQIPGVGDYSVAQFGEFDDDGRLLLVHGMASNRWTRKEFIKQIVGWCQRVDWWPRQVVKEKVTTDDFLTELSQEFARLGQPVGPFPVPRRGSLAKPDFIAGTLQVPVEDGRLIIGAGYPSDLFKQLRYQLMNLGSSSHDDIADATTLFFVDGVRVDGRKRDVPRVGSGFVLPSLNLYDPKSPRRQRADSAQQGLRIDPPTPDTAMLSRMANDPKMARALQGMGWAPGMVRWTQSPPSKPGK